MGTKKISLVQTDDRLINQLQQNISQALNPIVGNPQAQGTLKTNISLVAGANTINHGLNDKLQGWIIVRQRATSSFYDTQDNNLQQDLTLILVSSNPVVVDIYFF